MSCLVTLLAKCVREIRRIETNVIVAYGANSRSRHFLSQYE
jgi:hypothetical protein